MGSEKNQRQTLTSEILLLTLILLAGQVSALTPSSGPPLREASFTRLASLDDVLFTEDVLQDVPQRSRLECGEQCAQTEGCAMFTFYRSSDSPPARCRLFGKVQGVGDTPADNRVDAAGAKTFDLSVSCPPGYELQCGRCLTAVIVYINYTEAQQRCSQMDGGRLVMTQTLEDLDCVRNFTLDKGAALPWVGADDKEVPGQFQWNDGTPLLDSSPLWASEAGDPVHRAPGSDCVYLSESQRKLRTDPFSCRYHATVACENVGM